MSRDFGDMYMFRKRDTFVQAKCIKCQRRWQSAYYLSPMSSITKVLVYTHLGQMGQPLIYRYFCNYQQFFPLFAIQRILTPQPGVFM
jgi:hypothetical protein